jgi:hypothetical protein
VCVCVCVCVYVCMCCVQEAYVPGVQIRSWTLEQALGQMCLSSDILGFT